MVSIKNESLVVYKLGDQDLVARAVRNEKIPDAQDFLVNISREQEYLGTWVLELNNLNQFSRSNLAVHHYKEDSKIVGDYHIWTVLNKTGRFDSCRERYLESVPVVGNLDDLVPENDSISIEGCQAILNIFHRTSETSKQIVNAAFEVMCQMDENHLPEFKKIFRDLRYHTPDSDSEESKANSLKAFNFIVYSLPWVLAATDMSDLGYKSVCFELYHHLCALDHVTTLSYLGQWQNTLYSWGSETAFWLKSASLINMDANQIMGIGSKVSWFVLKYSFRPLAQRPYLLPMFNRTTNLVIGMLLLDYDSTSLQESTEVEQSSVLIRNFGIPTMRPR